MKKFRKIVPHVALVLSTSLLLSIAGCAIAMGTPEPERLTEINQLAFQAIQFDAQSLFARQVSDGETESTDENLRQDSKVFHALVTQELSLSVSSSVRHISSQLPPFHMAGGQRCILYRSLII